MAKRKKSLRKAMKNRGGFVRKGPEKPKTAPSEIQEKPKKPGWLRKGKPKKLPKPKGE